MFSLDCLFAEHKLFVLKCENIKCDTKYITTNCWKWDTIAYCYFYCIECMAIGKLLFVFGTSRTSHTCNNSPVNFAGSIQIPHV